MDESKSKPETGAVLESVERQPVEPARRRLAAVAAAPPLDGPVRQRLTADPLAFLRRRYGDFARVDCVLFFPSKIHFDSFVNDNGSLSLSLAGSTSSWVALLFPIVSHSISFSSIVLIISGFYRNPIMEREQEMKRCILGQS